jgi:hypothetical protein
MGYRILIGLFVCIALGCDDLDDFRTGPGEVFEGTVAGSETGDEGSFIRTGFVAGTRLELTFNPDFSLESDEEIDPGTISTFKPAGEDDDEEAAGDFQNTALDVISPLAHDPLMKYSFPGGGRIRNYIFSALYHGGTRSAFIFVSLMEDKDIEIRIIAPRVESACESDNAPNRELFGVFRLKRVSR